NGGIGVTAYSDYPNSDTYYRLRRYSGVNFQMSKHPDSQSNDLGGITESSVAMTANTWYSFRIKVENDTDNNRTLIKARIWPSSQAEDTSSWDIEAYDSSARRITSGTVGVWTMRAGTKSFDDFLVTEIIDDNGGGGGSGGKKLPRPTITPGE
ncbi:hypothetical protein ACFL04_02630, partial [Patescibacteria group bacterium]